MITLSLSLSVCERYNSYRDTDLTSMGPTTTKPPQIELSKGTRRPNVRKLTEEEKRLHAAAKKNNYTALADLCAKGIDPNVADIQNNGFTALHLAAANYGIETLQTLARCSANLNAKDFDGNTPLHIAVIADYSWSADMLLILDANPNIYNNEGKSPRDLVTPMKKSFANTFTPETMKWINEIRSLSDQEKVLLNLVQNGYYLTVVGLCKKGVDVRVKDVNHKQYTILHYAVTIKNNVPGTIQTLLRCGADINARDADGNTPLHLAALNKMNIAQNTLLLNGADLYIANKAGRTAYQILKVSAPDAVDSRRLQWYRNSMPI